MGGLRKLRRSGHSRNDRLEPLRPKDLFLSRKMSEVLMDFAEPLLDKVDSDERFEDAISFAVICWNMSFLPKNEQKKMISDMVDELGRVDFMLRTQVESCARMLQQRKKFLFADDRRMVLDYKIVEEKGHERLLVVSTLAND